MNIWPLRFRELADGRVFLADDAGTFFLSDRSFVDRYGEDRLTTRDRDFLLANGHAFETESEPAYNSFAWRWSARQAKGGRLRYVILVPTLRCNLACTYCQVSRAPETARGFDWTPEALAQVLGYLEALSGSEIKIEFQGGEPLLRLDLLNAVRDFCRARFARSEFVVCTNLQSIGPAELDFLSASDTYVSTSVDGVLSDHDRHRTQNPALAKQFFENLGAVRRVAAGRISALPTIDLDQPPDLDALIRTYEDLGQNSIFLRPVNYQGFARRRHPAARDVGRWNQFHENFVRKIIERNYQTGGNLGEYYLTLCLKRMLAPGHDGHVDLRNPGLLGDDYLVIDQDGVLYPTDEARMVSRIGLADLSIGTVAHGVDHQRLAALNGAAFNHLDPDCVHCPYQPFCGVDPVDDISRYGRLDLPKHLTWFCGRHLALFDLAARLLFSRDEMVQHSLRQWLDLPEIPIGLAPVHYDPTAPTR
ncbi:MAG TPA: His-Xaa-Ser system radical SAM maturase HxsB [Devosia sp.]|jgi:His-Xaa-Ser system radical SAM maturase HxsB|uniref:His-Xaa-Ser system radical SAM maturase HxsB n=1 Tax=Devosia sp. TaxID=1871048 RepID=UPI002DDCC1FC|nr:His-Xaa-Ser system radical SAM maturase HxsB [Devosia sp.]HEV2515167.1 His-Xaa-Ser system radical SAM maturase HxsB [Devosia sp.]